MDATDASSGHYTTYHCFCSQLVLATRRPLEKFDKRRKDGAYIAELATSGIHIEGAVQLASGGAVTAKAPTVIRLEDGFEKRYLVSCARCSLKLGYQLDESQYDPQASRTGVRQSVIHLLPGGLTTTEDMLKEPHGTEESRSTVVGAG